MSQQLKPTLFQYAACPFCWKVRSILAFKGIDYDTVEVHPLNKKELSFTKYKPAHLLDRMNKLPEEERKKYDQDYKKVPLFADANGCLLPESTDIMRLIDAQYPEPKVFTDSAQEKEWLEWSDKVFVRAIPPLIYETFGQARKAFDYITKVSKFNWLQQRLIKYTGAFVMVRVAKGTRKTLGIENPKEHFKSCLNHLVEGMGGRDYLGGDRPNGADLAIFGFVRSIEELPEFSLVQGNQDAYAWFQRLLKQVELADRGMGVQSCFCA
jgi:microsomal prostaglandin-E synthase 2